MPEPYRFLVAESEAPEDRAARRESTGQSSGETYAGTLRALVPGALCDQIKPAEGEAEAVSADALRRYDAVFFCGSPLHVYEETPETARLLAFMRAVFRSGTPAFGSCAGLQVAVAAAGGRVRSIPEGREAGFARRIAPTEAGRHHPLLAGRPPAYDAPTAHGDEVEALPEGAVLLATGSTTHVQAAEIRFAGGVFWGVQYHPELSLHEIAAALRRQAGSLVSEGLAASRAAAETHADRVEALAREPGRRDLAWQLGLDAQVTDPALRQLELRNFLRHLVEPVRTARGRG